MITHSCFTYIFRFLKCIRLFSLYEVEQKKNVILTFVMYLIGYIFFAFGQPSLTIEYYVSYETKKGIHSAVYRAERSTFETPNLLLCY